MRAEFQKLKNCTILDETVTIKSTLKESQLADVDAYGAGHFRFHAEARPGRAQGRRAG